MNNEYLIKFILQVFYIFFLFAVNSIEGAILVGILFLLGVGYEILTVLKEKFN